MSMRKSVFWAKLLQFEYWNWLFFYTPIIPTWLWYALKTRSLTYFSAVNPAVPFGGFLREDKNAVNKLLPAAYIPHSQFIRKGTPAGLICLNIAFPMVAKPNSGQRGMGVSVLDSYTEFENYHRQATDHYILQPFIQNQLEFAVFYSKIPGEKKGKVSSLTQKGFLSVTGDGQHSIRELMQLDMRARMQIETLTDRSKIDLNEVPQQGEIRLLEPIGNHCRGTRFVACNQLINSKLESVFDKIMENVTGFYYGRFDLKVESLASLYEGNGIQILELNGITADAAHIFDSGYSIWQAYADVSWHWKRMAEIAKVNLAQGVKPLQVAEAWDIVCEKFGNKKEPLAQKYKDELVLN